jgi:hypothetical protein
LKERERSGHSDQSGTRIDIRRCIGNYRCIDSRQSEEQR